MYKSLDKLGGEIGFSGIIDAIAAALFTGGDKVSVDKAGFEIFIE